MKSLHPANDNAKEDLIWHTRRVWQPRLSRDLSRHEAGQLATNVTGFFSVLSEWSRNEAVTAANDNKVELSTDPAATEKRRPVGGDRGGPDHD